MTSTAFKFACLFLCAVRWWHWFHINLGRYFQRWFPYGFEYVRWFKFLIRNEYGSTKNTSKYVVLSSKLCVFKANLCCCCHRHRFQCHCCCCIDKLVARSWDETPFFSISWSNQNWKCATVSLSCVNETIARDQIDAKHLKIEDLRKIVDTNKIEHSLNKLQLKWLFDVVWMVCLLCPVSALWRWSRFWSWCLSIIDKSNSFANEFSCFLFFSETPYSNWIELDDYISSKQVRFSRYMTCFHSSSTIESQKRLVWKCGNEVSTAATNEQKKHANISWRMTSPAEAAAAMRLIRLTGMKYANLMT